MVGKYFDVRYGTELGQQWQEGRVLTRNSWVVVVVVDLLPAGPVMPTRRNTS